MLSRRQFLSLSGGAGAAAAISAGAWAGLLRERAGDAPGQLVAGGPTTTAPNAAGSRTLVVVQLGGGNDALNTVVPEDGRYRDARPTLAIPEADILSVPHLDGAGLHPAMAPLVDLWAAGQIALLQSVGYSHAGRSHFECSQHWWDGTEPGEPSPTGWLGRWLDVTDPGGEPNPLRALALGAGSPALRAARAGSTVVLDPASFGIAAPSAVDAVAVADALAATARPVSPESLLAASQSAITSALRSVELLAEPLAAEPVERTLSTDLALAADLVTRGLGIEVLTVGATGFDTHASQADTHATLLADLAGGLQEFWQAVTDAGVADRVLVATTSEFGRRVVENGSAGSDHGLAGHQLLMGPSVAGATVGTVNLANLHDGDLAPAIDPRSLYAAALDWLGGPTDEVLSGYEDLALLR